NSVKADRGQARDITPGFCPAQLNSDSDREPLRSRGALCLTSRLATEARREAGRTMPEDRETISTQARLERRRRRQEAIEALAEGLWNLLVHGGPPPRVIERSRRPDARRRQRDQGEARG